MLPTSGTNSETIGQNSVKHLFENPGARCGYNNHAGTGILLGRAGPCNRIYNASRETGYLGLPGG
jgi:hypothetical protein